MTYEFEVKKPQSSWLYCHGVEKLPLIEVDTSYKCPDCEHVVKLKLTLQDLFGNSSERVRSNICMCHDTTLVFEVKPFVKLGVIAIPDDAWTLNGSV